MPVVVFAIAARRASLMPWNTNSQDFRPVDNTRRRFFRGEKGLLIGGASFASSPRISSMDEEEASPIAIGSTSSANRRSIKKTMAKRRRRLEALAESSLLSSPWERAAAFAARWRRGEEVVEEVFAQLFLFDGDSDSDDDSNDDSDDSHSSLELAAALAAEGYLEEVLWPCVGGTSSMPVAVLVSIAAVCAAKGPSAWRSLGERRLAEGFRPCFDGLAREAVAAMKEGDAAFRTYLATYASFLSLCFASLDVAAVRKVVLRYASLPTWAALTDDRRRREFTRYPQLERHWHHILQRRAAAAKSSSSSSLDKDTTTKREEAEAPEALLLPLLAKCAVDLGGGKGTRAVLSLLTDLASQLPTRRFLRTVLVDMRVYERLDIVFSSSVGKTKKKKKSQDDDEVFLEAYRSALDVDVEDQTGAAPSRTEVAAEKRRRYQKFQKASFDHLGDLGRDIAFGTFKDQDDLAVALERIPGDGLRVVAARLGVETRSAFFDDDHQQNRETTTTS
mmetsp:Transcript_34151/g.109609  ORF Transcript_34151/g.109609 Transcript_34151/m.109609 type:complete len:505 (-) Transcript_34151:100-1614(-)